MIPESQNRATKVVWGARAGLVDLLPRVEAKMREMKYPLESIFLCHTPKDEKHLRERYGIECVRVLSTEISGFVPAERNLGDEIRAIEHKYDTIPLIRLVWSTMFETGLREKEIMQQTISHFRFWENLLEQSQIDILVYERPSMLSTCVAWVVCQKLGIPHLDFGYLPFEKCMAFMSSWNGNFDGIKRKMHEPLSTFTPEVRERAVFAIERIRRETPKASYGDKGLEFFKKSATVSPGKIKSLPFLFSQIRASSKYFTNYSILQYVRRRSSLLANGIFHRLYNVFEVALPEADKYFLFPLPQITEWSNSVWAGLHHWDLLDSVNRTSKCLPLGYKLYVKEHISFYNERPLRDFGFFKKLERVKLISPYANTNQLLKNCAGVITLGGTMGFEAILLDKPAFVLGKPWYLGYPGVVEIDSFEQLAYALQRRREISMPTDLQKQQIVCSIMDVCFPGVRLPHDETLDPENIGQFALAFKGKFDRLLNPGL